MDLLALSSLAFVGSITPGPNNVMLWASGLNHGLRRTLPHVFGIWIGFASLLLAVGVGLGAVVTGVPAVGWLLRLAGSAYLLYLAYRVATSAPAGRGGSEHPPLTLWQAAAFQYANPKAWVLGITAAAIANLEPGRLGASVALYVGVFAAINLPCILVWAGAGTAVGRILASERRLIIINRALGLLLAASVVLIVL
jgi:threonine/homoserine/homoserine lactone efflux protein